MPRVQEKLDPISFCGGGLSTETPSLLRIGTGFSIGGFGLAPQVWIRCIGVNGEEVGENTGMWRRGGSHAYRDFNKQCSEKRPRTAAAQLSLRSSGIKPDK